MIFVSAPYSHNEPAVVEERYKQVVSYIAKQLNAGIIAISPNVYGHNIVQLESLPSDWEFWNKFCIEFLRKCTEMHVLQLPGWENSNGVGKEIELAKMLHIPIKYISI